jgi:hypothetical protein
MEAVREAFIRVIKWRVEKKLPDNISEIKNNFIQECGPPWHVGDLDNVPATWSQPKFWFPTWQSTIAHLQ